MIVEDEMRVNITIEIDVEDLPTLRGAPTATVDDFIGMLKLHTSSVVSNYEGKIVKFAAEKA